MTLRINGRWRLACCGVKSDAQHVHDQIKTKLGIDGNVVSVP
jgi:hypothetical protein